MEFLNLNLSYDSTYQELKQVKLVVVLLTAEPHFRSYHHFEYNNTFTIEREIVRYYGEN